MSKEALSVDSTHIKNVANPSGVKKASGDNASGVDAATLKAVAENLVVNGMIDLSAVQLIERSTQSHLNNSNITSVSAAQKTEQRSEKINELALGMQNTNFKSSKVDSLGDMMCELMILMIKSTSERRQMEREFRTVLVTANLVHSEEIAKNILEKMKLDIEQIRDSAIGNLVSSIAGMAVTAGGMMKKTSGGFADIRGSLNMEQMIGQTSGQLINSVAGLSNLDNIKKSAELESSISRKKTAITLTQSIASSVEKSLKSIDSTRDYFLSLMTQISQMEHDSKMQIIRNSAI